MKRYLVGLVSAAILVGSVASCSGARSTRRLARRSIEPFSFDQVSSVQLRHAIKSEDDPAIIDLVLKYEAISMDFAGIKYGDVMEYHQVQIKIAHAKEWFGEEYDYSWKNNCTKFQKKDVHTLERITRRLNNEWGRVSRVIDDREIMTDLEWRYQKAVDAVQGMKGIVEGYECPSNKSKQL